MGIGLGAAWRDTANRGRIALALEVITLLGVMLAPRRGVLHTALLALALIAPLLGLLLGETDLSVIEAVGCAVAAASLLVARDRRVAIRPATPRPRAVWATLTAAALILGEIGSAGLPWDVSDSRVVLVNLGVLAVAGLRSAVPPPWMGALARLRLSLLFLGLACATFAVLGGLVPASYLRFAVFEIATAAGIARAIWSG